MIKRLLGAALARQGSSIIDTAQLELQYSELDRLRTEIDRLAAENARLTAYVSPPAAHVSSDGASDPRINDIDRLLFKDLPLSARSDVQFFDRL